VFEQLVFACCLENAHYDRAELAYAALTDTGSFFDFNEIRVSTVRELSEAMACLPDPPAAANRVKRVLQSVFESTYSYDLEDLRKQNLGPAVERLKKLDGATNFCVAYVTQVALGGHAIPVDAGALRALEVVDLVGEQDVLSVVVPGLDRAIAKTRGIEFGSLLHQFGADFVANPYAPALHRILVEIDPSAGDRLPKRRSRRRAAASGEKGGQTEVTKPAGKGPKDESQHQEAKGKRGRASACKKAEEGGSAQRTKKAAPPEKGDSPQTKAAPGAKKKSSGTGKRPVGKKKADGGHGNPETAPETNAPASAGLSKRKPR
jgi:endonuclease III